MNDTRAQGADSVSFTAPTKPGLVVVVVTAGAVLGAGPVAFAFHRPWLVATVALVAFAVSLRSSTTLMERSFHEPSILEFVLTGVRVAALCAAVSLIWLALYYAIYWIIRLVNPDANREGYAFWISIWFGLLFIGGLTWAALRNLPSELYPDRPETPRRFEVMLKYQRRELLTRMAVGAVALVALCAYALGFHRNGLTLYIVLIVVLMAVAGLLSPAHADAPADEQELARTLEAALDRAGFHCRRDLKTSDGAAIPNVDLLAEKEGRSLAVDLVKGGPGGPVEWVAGAGIASATRRLVQQDVVDRETRPALVLVDATPDRSLRSFCESERVTLAVIPIAGDADLQLLDGDDPDLAAGFHTFQLLLRGGKGRMASMRARAERRASMRKRTRP